MTTSKENARSRQHPRALVIDDEDDIRELLDMTLVQMGLSVDCAGSVAQAKQYLEKERYRLCLTDMRLPDGNGLEIVRLVGSAYAQTPIAVITAFGSTDNAIAALKAGAFDYLSKPVMLDQLRALVKSVLNLPPSGKPSSASPRKDKGNALMIGVSPAMQHVRELIEKLARSQAPVYISGESGSGKELAARRIHEHSACREAPFIPVNCGAIPENLMESEFFGYRKGAFTGADNDRDGFFQAANGGTLFLDEVADLPMAMQVKLLRAIQEKKIRKVGATNEEPVNARIVSATHKNLKACLDNATFRQDLYYRLNVIELKMPSLRERKEDIPLLVESFLSRMTIGKTAPPALTPDAMRVLIDYSYPGNVRELENILERATALCTNERIDTADLHLDIEPAALGEEPIALIAGLNGKTLDEHVNQVERQLILDALEKTKFNRTAAARLLGVSFRSLRYRIDRLEIDANE